VKTRTPFAAAALFAVLSADPAPIAAQDKAAGPLPSWNDGPAKKAVVDFVAKVTRDGSPDFVAIADRVAVFDNDGTLWSEQPVYFQLAFALDRVKALADKHPEWKGKQPFKGVLAGDLKGALAGGEKAAFELMIATHTGMTTDEFDATVRDWLKAARHPKFDRPYTDLVFQPMQEVLTHLRANGFKTYIVSGGGIDFMRVFAEQVYGIPPGQVVGSTGKTKYEVRDGKPVLVKLPEIEHIDDGPGKPVGIHKFIGRRPVMCFGNSDGDFHMLQWTTSGAGPRFGLIVRHTDAEREWAYDRESHIGKLDKALDAASKSGWTVMDMKKDWRVIYPFQK
jgi:phosphoglycolate phosphatase-like HAD superfamily hydrolase